MLSVLDPLLGTFFELLKNKFLTWIASGGTKVDESRKLGVVVSGKFGYSGRLRAPAMHGVSSLGGPSEVTANRKCSIIGQNLHVFCVFYCENLECLISYLQLFQT